MQVNLYRFAFFSFTLLMISCGPDLVVEEHVQDASFPNFEAISLFGDTLRSSRPSAQILQRAALAEAVYQADPTDPNAVIWHGRWAAYTGSYRKSIAIFSEAIERFPDDARLYRHRGHRYISIRAFELAEIDFKKAWGLCKDKPDLIEPDGMPNATFIPISTLQSNVLYHLGLSLYLQNKLPEAAEVYREDIARGGNNDQLVSTVHWLYMSLRLQGLDTEAEEALEVIQKDMPVIENMDYLKLCLFYKGEITIDQLLPSPEAGSAGDAVLYGLANWYFYNGNIERAKESLEILVMGRQWNSFGHIAAEAQYVRAFVKGPGNS